MKTGSDSGSERSEDESSEASLALFIDHDSSVYASDDEDYEVESRDCIMHSSLELNTKSTAFQRAEISSKSSPPNHNATETTSLPTLRFLDQPARSNSSSFCFPGELAVVTDAFPVVCFPDEPQMINDAFPVLCFPDEPGIPTETIATFHHLCGHNARQGSDLPLSSFSPLVSLAEFPKLRFSSEPVEELTVEELTLEDLVCFDDNDLRPSHRTHDLYYGAKTTQLPSSHSIAVAVAHSPDNSMRPGYPNKELSCWLDCSLEIFNCCAKRNSHDFHSRFSHAPDGSPLQLLATCLSGRREAEEKGLAELALIELLTKQRDTFRAALSAQTPSVIKSAQSMENVFAWLADLLRNCSKHRLYDPIQLYFKAAHVTFRTCFAPTTSDETRSLHRQHDLNLHWRFFFQPSSIDYDKWGSDIGPWITSLFTQSTSDPIPCWLTDTKISCVGDARLTEHYVSVPGILLVELPVEPSWHSWNLPQKIPLMHKRKGCEDITYELYGRVFYHEISRHWTTRVVEYGSNFEHRILDYDGLQQNGQVREVIGATIGSHLAGTDVSANIPVGSRTAYAVYYLNGGLDAQERFYSYQAERLHQDHDIVLSSSSLQTLYSAEVRSSLPLSEIVRDLVYQEKRKDPTFNDIFAVMDSARSAKGIASDSDLDDATTTFSKLPKTDVRTTEPSIGRAHRRFNKFLVSIGKLPRGAQVSKKKVKDAVIIQCLVCDGLTHIEGGIIQCWACQLWHHKSCIDEQFGLPQARSKTWRCAKCTTSTPMWDESDSLIGQYILYRQSSREKLYPARVARREGLNAVIVWYYGNKYHRADRRIREPEERVPIHRLAAAAKYSRMRSEPYDIGPIKLPLCMAENANEKGYENESVVSALKESMSSILEILQGERPHPIIQRYHVDLVETSSERPSDISKWVAEHDIICLPGDKSLAETLILPLFRALVRNRESNPSRSGVSDEKLMNLALGPGLFLLHMVIVRVYLRRTPADDDEIFRIITSSTDEIRAQSTRDSEPFSDTDDNDRDALDKLLKNLEESDSFRPSVRILRSLSEPEQAFAACNQWTDTTSWEGAVHNPSLAPEQIYRPIGITLDKDLPIRYDGPIAYVDVMPDSPDHLWPPSTSQGLSGGPPYSSCFKESDQRSQKVVSTRKPTSRRTHEQGPSAERIVSNKVSPQRAHVTDADPATKRKQRRSDTGGSSSDLAAVVVKRSSRKRRIVDSE